MVRSYDVGTLTIASSGTTSNELAAYGLYKYAKSLAVQAPSALTDTVNIQATLDGTQWVNINTIAAGAVLSFDNEGYTAIRALSGGAEGAARAFTVRAVEEIT